MKKFRTSQSAFTLIELLVTTGIFLVLTSVVLAKYRSYSVKTTVANTAETIVLSLREAQVYGTSGRATSTTAVQCGGSAFNCPYGVRLIANNPTYVIFVDKDGSGTYNNVSERVEAINLPSGVNVSALSPNSPLDIVFKRPFPDALINNVLGNLTASFLGSNSTNSATVRMTSAGQITIE